MIYKVRHNLDSDYIVVEVDDNEEDLSTQSNYREETVFSGGLADCEAFIRLKEGGFFN